MTATRGLDRLGDLIAGAPPELVREFGGRLRGTQADLYARAEQQAHQRADENDWRAWLPWLFPSYFPVAFAPHHAEFWDWLWAIELGIKPLTAFIGCWARGGGKSVSAEAGLVALGARRRRRYCVYVCETQDQADDHVGNIGTMLESEQVGAAYPMLGDRMLGKFGSVKGWRRNRLRCADGFTIDALGLDTAARGMRLDEDRPDLLCFDDVDSDTDGPGKVEKKVNAITKKLLPAGSEDLAVLGIQNLVHAQGVFGRLVGAAEESADFLATRIVSGPVPALEDATFDRGPDGGWKIVAGRPTWEGQDLATCQYQVDDWGYTAFLAEAQHDTDAKGGGMFDHIAFAHCERDDVPALMRTEVWVDPAVTNTDKSDSMAVQCDGLAADGTIYRLRSWEQRTTPVNALKLAIAWAMCEGASRVGVETDQGGDTWRSVYKEALQAVRDDLARIRAGDGADGLPEYVRALAELAGREPSELLSPFFGEAKAGSTQQPKEHRIQQMLTQGYEKAGAIVHVLGTHAVLERALFRFPARKPYDLADAAYWCWKHLAAFGQPTRTSASAGVRRPFPKMPVTRPGIRPPLGAGFGRVR